jgi:hypothetical protein
MVGHAQWSEAELALALNRSLSAREVATRVGRTPEAVKSVRYARHRYARPIPDAAHGSLTGVQCGCRCVVCEEFGRQYRAITVDPLAMAMRGRTFYHRQQAVTLPKATNYGARWNTEELAVARDRQMAVRDAAMQLGRTAGAITAVRNRYNRDGARPANSSDLNATKHDRASHTRHLASAVRGTR